MPGSKEATGGHAGNPRVIGLVGAGQLARMMGEAASELGLSTVVLAEDPSDAATAVCGNVVIGSAKDAEALRTLANRCDVVTFDHEQVNLEALRALVDEGFLIRPGLATLELAVDKAQMRERFSKAGIPVPPFVLLGEMPETEVSRQLETFGARHGWPLVLKFARGGYDGKGVFVVANLSEAALVCARAREAATEVVVESLVPFERELAVLVARGPDGAMVNWRPVETAQAGGVCREVLIPGALSEAESRRAEEVARAVAEECDAQGLLAVELFSVGGDVLVNEIAARPHNTGHWTIEGAVTSQFENHLRAVCGLPLGSTALAAPQVASVNIFGATGGVDPRAGLSKALGVEGAHVHLYGKEPRPGRKLGHVTVCGTNDEDVRSRAWRAAIFLGTDVPDGTTVPESEGV